MPEPFVPRPRGSRGLGTRLVLRGWLGHVIRTLASTHARFYIKDSQTFIRRVPMFLFYPGRL